mgnify:CR=1 FL=1
MWLNSNLALSRLYMYKSIVRPLLYQMPPEQAHYFTTGWLERFHAFEATKKIIEKKEKLIELKLPEKNKIEIEKIGVDPVSGGNFRGTSDEFFKQNKLNTYFFSLCFSLFFLIFFSFTIIIVPKILICCHPCIT